MTYIPWSQNLTRLTEGFDAIDAYLDLVDKIARQKGGREGHDILYLLGNLRYDVTTSTYDRFEDLHKRITKSI